jgi:hypothetical protein
LFDFSVTLLCTNPLGAGNMPSSTIMVKSAMIVFHVSPRSHAQGIRHTARGIADSAKAQKNHTPEGVW